jgi:hypothetical protein
MNITEIQQPETQMEIGANVVALVKLPMRVEELDGIIKSLLAVHGKGLCMMEQPQGWLQFLKP